MMGFLTMIDMRATLEARAPSSSLIIEAAGLTTDYRLSRSVTYYWTCFFGILFLDVLPIAITMLRAASPI